MSLTKKGRPHLKRNNKIKKITSKKLPAYLVVFLFLFLPIAAYPQDYGDTLVSASISDARTLIPILASDSSSADICAMIFNGLVKFDKDINLIGDLAQSWEIKDNGLAIIFNLRKDVRWQDGEPFGAPDVEFTYKKLIDPNVKTPYSGDFERVKSLEVIDDHKIKITYKEPFSPGLASWGMSILPKHILEKEDLNNAKFSRNPIGTGPYKFKKWLSQEKIELISNKDYFEGRPYIDRYVFRIIPDSSTIFLEMQTLDVDSSILTPLQYTRQTENSFFKKNYQKFRTQSFNYTYLGYNLNNPLFKDGAVRRALNYAVNKNEIIKAVLLGLGRPCTGPFARDSWAYNKDVEAVEFDPSKAKELLKSAGWSDIDKDGILEKNNKKFEFTVIVNQGSDERLKAAEIIQRRLSEVGIKMKIRVIEWSVFINEFINKRKFDAVLLGWSLGMDPDNYDIWHSSKTKEGEFNFIGYKNEAVDKLLEAGRREFDKEKRKEIYHKIHAIIYDEQPCMFLYTQDSLPIISSRVCGIKPEPIGIGYNFIKWYVPKKLQRYNYFNQ